GHCFPMEALQVTLQNPAFVTTAAGLHMHLQFLSYRQVFLLLPAVHVTVTVYAAGKALRVTALLVFRHFVGVTGAAAIRHGGGSLVVRESLGSRVTRITSGEAVDRVLESLNVHIQGFGDPVLLDFEIRVTVTLQALLISGG